MPREKIGPAVMVRFREEVLARIDAEPGTRADLIRAAVDEYLGAIDGIERTRARLDRDVKSVQAAVERAKSDPLPKVEVTSLGAVTVPKPRIIGDLDVMLAEVRKGAGSVRDIARRLEWNEMRAEKVAQKLADAHLILFSAGVMEAL